METVLVTGGAGFIGRKLVRVLLEAGHTVTVLDALTSAVHGDNPGLPEEIRGARFVLGDVRDKVAWLSALSGATLVYHLAAETGTGESMYRARRYVDVNVGGTALLCDLLLHGAADQVARVVLASSRAVYGEGPYRCPQHGVVVPPQRSTARLAAGLWEPMCPTGGCRVTSHPASPKAPTAPTSIYGVTKRDQEEVLRLLLASIGISVVSLRLQNVFGQGQSLKNPYTGVISQFAARLRSKQRVRIFEDGRESRDFVYVNDVVDAFARAGRIVPDHGHTVIDVGSGTATTLIDVARILCRRLSVSMDLLEVTGEYRVGDVRHAVADTSDAREVLGLPEPISLEAGLDRCRDFFEVAGPPASMLDRALHEMEAVGLMGRASTSS